MHMILGPYRVCVNCDNVDAVDAVTERKVVLNNGTKGKEWTFDVILSYSGERVLVDGFKSNDEADTERDRLLRDGLIVDIDDAEEEEDDETKEINKKPAIERNWEVDKKGIVEEVTPAPLLLDRPKQEEQTEVSPS